MSNYALPDLSYDYGALEPYVSGKIMELHHAKHHAAYVQGANDAIEQLDEARKKSDFARIAGVERALAFNLSGHVLHSMFWRNLTPEGGERPSGALAEAIDRDFGAFGAYRAQMIKAASTIMGSGWAALVWDPFGRRLITTQIHDHQSNMNIAGIPILVLDAWEHAYYLQYQNRKAEFFEAVWDVWNWPDAEERFGSVSGIDVRVPGTVTNGATGDERRPQAP